MEQRHPRLNTLEILWRYAPMLLRGAGVTLWTWLLGSVLGLVLGGLLALLRQSPIQPLRWVLRAYIEIIRGTPFMLQLFLVYFGGPAVGVRLSAITAGVLCLAVHSAAYFAEIFRAGLECLPAGQKEAAAAIGMTSTQILLRISLPGMLVAVFPSIVSMLISVSKETVILSVITVPNLMYEVQSMTDETYSTLAGITALAAFYWILVQCIGVVGAWMERHWTLHLTTDHRNAAS
jgi:polar amino acid transport system permease protein